MKSRSVSVPQGISSTHGAASSSGSGIPFRGPSVGGMSVSAVSHQNYNGNSSSAPKASSSKRISDLSQLDLTGVSIYSTAGNDTIPANSTSLGTSNSNRGNSSSSRSPSPRGGSSQPPSAAAPYSYPSAERSASNDGTTHSEAKRSPPYHHRQSPPHPQPYPHHQHQDIHSSSTTGAPSNNNNRSSQGKPITSATPRLYNPSVSHQPSVNQRSGRATRNSCNNNNNNNSSRHPSVSLLHNISSASTKFAVRSNISSRRRATATAGGPGPAQQHQHQRHSPAQNKDNSAAGAKGESLDWIAELTAALGKCARNLSTYTMLLPTRTHTVSQLVECLQRAHASVIHTTLPNHSDVVVAIDRIVPVLLFQLKSPRTDDSVRDLLEKCCTALRLIAEMLGQLLPVHTSLQVATGTIEALLLQECANDFIASSPHLNFLQRDHHPWEQAAMDCCSAVARCMEAPGGILPIAIPRIRNVFQFISTFGEEGNDYTQQKQQHHHHHHHYYYSYNNFSAAASPQYGASGAGGNSGLGSRSSSVVGGRSGDGDGGGGGSCSASNVSSCGNFLFSKVTSLHQQEQLKIFQNDRKVLFVVELILTLLEDVASKTGVERLYALFPTRQQRLSTPFVVPRGVRIGQRRPANQNRNNSLAMAAGRDDVNDLNHTSIDEDNNNNNNNQNSHNNNNNDKNNNNDNENECKNNNNSSSSSSSSSDENNVNEDERRGGSANPGVAAVSSSPAAALSTTTATSSSSMFLPVQQLQKWFVDNCCRACDEPRGVWFRTLQQLQEEGGIFAQDQEYLPYLEVGHDNRVVSYARPQPSSVSGGNSRAVSTTVGATSATVGHAAMGAVTFLDRSERNNNNGGDDDDGNNNNNRTKENEDQHHVAICVEGFAEEDHHDDGVDDYDNAAYPYHGQGGRVVDIRDASANEGAPSFDAAHHEAPHPIDSLDWESEGAGDGVSELWNLFCLLSPGCSVELQVRALALAYTFYPDDVATLMDKCWNVDIITKKRCLNGLRNNPPFSLLIVHEELVSLRRLLNKKPQHEIEQSTEKNKKKDAEQQQQQQQVSSSSTTTSTSMPVVVGSMALVPF